MYSDFEELNSVLLRSYRNTKTAKRLYFPVAKLFGVLKKKAAVLNRNASLRERSAFLPVSVFLNLGNCISEAF